MSNCLPLYFFLAIGRSTGAHGAFRDYQIDAVTLNMFASGDLESSSYQIDLFTRYGRFVILCLCCHHLVRLGERHWPTMASDIL